MSTSTHKHINPVAKGRRNEKKTEQWLVNKGFLVHTTRRSSYKGGSNDLFGLWDHIAVCVQPVVFSCVSYLPYSKQAHPLSLKEGDVLFVQTKSNQKPAQKYLQQLAAFPTTNKLVVVWHDRLQQPNLIALEQL
jgi:hypothetical protein